MSQTQRRHAWEYPDCPRCDTEVFVAGLQGTHTDARYTCHFCGAEFDPLKHKTNNELRRDIAYTIGADPTRYPPAEQVFFTGEELSRIAEQVGTDATEYDHRELVRYLSRVVDEPLYGAIRNLRRPQLKALYRRLDAREP